MDAAKFLQSGLSAHDVAQEAIVNDIARLEEEWLQIERLFIHIRDQRDRLLQDLSSHRALLPPINRIPSEILLEIFRHISSSSMCSGVAPWNLGHVCSTWRTVSRSSPSLWTYISFSESSTHDVTFLTTYLSLSQDLPISIALYPRSDAKSLECLQVIAAHSARWSTLDLMMKSETLSRFLSYVSAPANQLRKLQINLLDILDERAVSVQTYNNPFLQSPVAIAILRQMTYSQLPVSLKRLKTLMFHHYDPSELLLVLKHAPQLTDLSIMPAIQPPDGTIRLLQNSYQVPTHASLRKLSIILFWRTTDSYTNIHSIFSSLLLPSLEHLRIGPGNPWVLPMELAPAEYSHILSLVGRSGCHLTSLALHIRFPVDAFFLPIVGFVSDSLSTLNIAINIHIAGEIFRILSTETGHLPNLQRLHLDEVPTATAHSGLLEESAAFHAMILSRWKRGFNTLRLSLSSEWVNVPFIIPPECIPRFRDLFRSKEEGLDVEFLFNDKDCLRDGEARRRFFGSS